MTKAFAQHAVSAQLPGPQPFPLPNPQPDPPPGPQPPPDGIPPAPRPVPPAPIPSPPQPTSRGACEFPPSRNLVCANTTNRTAVARVCG